MGSHCCKPVQQPLQCCDMLKGKHGWDCTYRQILWAVLAINTIMFVVEIGSGLHAGSQSLLADALDFFGDAANYVISLFVLNKSSATRSRASLIKGISMGVFGLWVVGSTVYKVFIAQLPDAEVMGIIGFIALVANLICALLLFKFRNGDSNRESVWVCSRNDAIGNIAVIMAAAGVFATTTKWPDLIVAGIIAILALTGAYRICKTAFKELSC